MNYETFVDKHFDVRSRGIDEWVAFCPWHGDQGKPNLCINVRKGVYLCQSCGVKGHLQGIANGVVKLDRHIDLGDLKERIRGLSISIPVEPIGTYPDEWLARFNFDHPYWETARGFSLSTIRQFNLGYDPWHDVMTIPIRDSYNRVKGVVKRRLDDQKPKYLYPKGVRIGKLLYGSWLVRGRYRKVALTEGPLDAVACWDAGIPALALFGSRLTEDQAHLLRTLGVKVVATMMDNDKYGDQAVEQIVGAAKGLTVLCGWYRNDWSSKDPGELRRAQRKRMFISAVPYHRWLDL